MSARELESLKESVMDIHPDDPSGAPFRHTLLLDSCELYRRRPEILERNPGRGLNAHREPVGL